MRFPTVHWAATTIFLASPLLVRAIPLPRVESLITERGDLVPNVPNLPIKTPDLGNGTPDVGLDRLTKDKLPNAAVPDVTKDLLNGGDITGSIQDATGDLPLSGGVPNDPEVDAPVPDLSGEIPKLPVTPDVPVKLPTTGDLDLPVRTRDLPVIPEVPNSPPVSVPEVPVLDVPEVPPKIETIVPDVPEVLPETGTIVPDVPEVPPKIETIIPEGKVPEVTVPDLQFPPRDLPHAPVPVPQVGELPEVPKVEIPKPEFGTASAENGMTLPHGTLPEQH